MHAIQTVSLLALAGSAVAAPWSWSSAWGQARYNNGGNRGHWDNNNNALKTVQNSDGSMVHELNPGTMAQVLAPGTSSDFENVFVGGWLCEIPTLPGLDGVCSTMSAGWSYNGETGHAKILTATSYSKIGCALYAGIWACDLA